MGKYNKKLAFTLAEVLITLGIIGVVAALTIPTLVSNYQNRAWNTASTVFERELEESLKVMNTQQVLAGYKTTEKFVEELQKHMKITKVCENDKLTDCFDDKVYWGPNDEEIDMSTMKLTAHFGQKGWGTNLVGLQLANGMSAVIGYNPKCKQDPYSNTVAWGECVTVLYDTSGYSSPNTNGKDLRSINVVSLGSKNCVVEIGNTCYSTISFPTALSYEDCEARKDELGITHCRAEHPDRWAGAVAACGGLKYMPSPEQLTDLANYLYNVNNIKPNANNSNLTLDYDKVAKLGINIKSGGYFHLWTNEEMDGTTCLGTSCTRSFWADSYTSRAGHHGNTDRRFVCVGN